MTHPIGYRNRYQQEKKWHGTISSILHQLILRRFFLKTDILCSPIVHVDKCSIIFTPLLGLNSPWTQIAHLCLSGFRILLMPLASLQKKECPCCPSITVSLLFCSALHIARHLWALQINRGADQITNTSHTQPLRNRTAYWKNVVSRAQRRN